MTKKTVKTEVKTNKFNWGESYKSLLLGLVVVVIVAVVIFSFGRNRQVRQTSSVQDGPVNQEEKIENLDRKTKAQKIYVVKKGDDLWNISQEIYKSGYFWLDIAKANNLNNPGLIFSGDKLIIPTIAAQTKNLALTQSKETKEVKTNTIVKDSYTVVKGDSIWDIAVRAYGDGYKWVDIAKANNLDNPDLIFSENVLKIPR